MDKDLMRFFCCLPVFTDSEQLHWKPKTSLKDNFKEKLDSKPDLSLEEALNFFIQGYRDGNDERAIKYLQAYLFRIAVQEAKKLHNKLEYESDYKSRYSLQDIYQIAFVVVCENTADILNKYDSKKSSLKSYAKTKLLSLISTQLCNFIGMNDEQKRAWKHSRLFNLKNPTGKKDPNQGVDEIKPNLKGLSNNANNIKQKLEYFGYSGLELERRLLSWQSLNKVYVPNKKYEKWTDEQLKQITESYQILRRRSPELKDDNLQVDAQLIDQWLEDCISAWYQSIPKPELSFDVPLKNSDVEGETWAEQIADYKYVWGDDAPRMNYYQAMGCDLQKSLTEFCQTLTKEKYCLVFLVFSFDWGDVGRNLGPLFNKDQSTINRWYLKIKKDWLNKLAKEQLGVARKEISKDIATSDYLEDVWQKYAKPHYKPIIERQFQKIWSKLEPSLQQMLSTSYPQLNPTAADTKKIANALKGIESELLQWLEAELEMSLASYKPLTKKISNLVHEFLNRTY